MRPPEVFVRELSPQEGARLKHLVDEWEVPLHAPARDDLAGLGERHERA